MTVNFVNANYKRCHIGKGPTNEEKLQRDKLYLYKPLKHIHANRLYKVKKKVKKDLDFISCL